jgi:hypothetical protein
LSSEKPLEAQDSQSQNLVSESLENQGPLDPPNSSPVAAPPEDAFAAPIRLPATSKRETDQDYASVIVYLNDRCRVIECADRIQWIIQRRRGQQWLGVSFHRSRDVLIERSGATGEALAVLNALPERYDGSGDLLDVPRCKTCGLWQCKPQRGLPRHLFCIALRKAA